jgi:hypothetical protein
MSNAVLLFGAKMIVVMVRPSTLRVTEEGK